MSEWISFVLFDPLTREDHFIVITLNVLSKGADILFQLTTCGKLLVDVQQ